VKQMECMLRCGEFSVLSAVSIFKTSAQLCFLYDADLYSYVLILDSKY
jgi:hypothetical protein